MHQQPPQSPAFGGGLPGYSAYDMTPQGAYPQPQSQPQPGHGYGYGFGQPYQQQQQMSYDPYTYGAGGAYAPSSAGSRPGWMQDNVTGGTHGMSGMINNQSLGYGYGPGQGQGQGQGQGGDGYSYPLDPASGGVGEFGATGMGLGGGRGTGGGRRAGSWYAGWGMR